MREKKGLVHPAFLQNLKYSKDTELTYDVIYNLNKYISYTQLSNYINKIIENNDISNKYRNMGKMAYESLMNYLCANKEIFPKFDSCNCKLSCGCSGACKCGKTKKLTGVKYSTVGKWTTLK